MYNIRMYKESDYKMLSEWWIEQGENVPGKDLIPEDSTFVLEVEGIPMVSLSAYLTNVSGMAVFENFVGNPLYKQERKEYSPLIMKHVENFLKEKGYKRVVCFGYKDKVKNHYQKMGMRKTLDNISSFVKELE